MDGLLFLNGSPPSQKVLSSIDYKKFYTVCADGAYQYLSKYCIPDVLVGDFDSLLSLEQNQLKAKKIVKLKVEKDFTDGHVAMQELLALNPDKIYIYGALGGDPDHELSNYSLLYFSAINNIESVIVSEKYNIYLAYGDFVCTTKTGKRVSLVPFSDKVHILGTRGLKYTINDEVYDKLHIKGISNIATESSVGYFIKDGYALVFVEK